MMENETMRYIRFLFAVFALVFALMSQNAAQATLPAPREDARPQVTTPLPAPTFKNWTIAQKKRSEYYPDAESFEAMVDNLQARGVNVGDGTHRAIPTLTAGIPHKPGVVAYFFLSPIAFDGMFMWMLEEYEERTSGLHVRFWFFSDEIRSYEADLSSDATPTTTKYFMPGDSNWNMAVEKSRLAWKLLCEKYGCVPHRYNAF